jgi:hypothetical protein
MPRTSKKERFLGSLTKILNKRLQHRALRTINDEEDSLADAVDLSVAMAIKNGFSRRYLFRKSKYRKGDDRFKIDLENNDVEEDPNDDGGDDIEEEAIQLPWLTDEEFLQKYRMTRSRFDIIVDLIKDNQVFKSNEIRGRKQAPVAHQLMVFLFCNPVVVFAAESVVVRFCCHPLQKNFHRRVGVFRPTLPVASPVASCIATQSLNCSIVACFATSYFKGWQWWK